MTLRSLVAAAALVLPACASTGNALHEAASPHSVPKLDLSAQHLAFPALVGDADLPSADAVAMHVDKVLGETAAADVRVCVDGAGKVASTSLLKSSGLAAYDAGVLADVKAWRFEAPTAGACTDLTVVYNLR